MKRVKRVHPCFTEIALIGLRLRKKYRVPREVMKVITDAYVPPLLLDGVPPYNYNPRVMVGSFFYSSTCDLRECTWYPHRDIIYLNVNYVLDETKFRQATLDMIHRGTFSPCVCCFCEDPKPTTDPNFIQWSIVKNINTDTKYTVCRRCAEWCRDEWHDTYSIVQLNV